MNGGRWVVVIWIWKIPPLRKDGRGVADLNVHSLVTNVSDCIVSYCSIDLTSKLLS